MTGARTQGIGTGCVILSYYQGHPARRLTFATCELGFELASVRALLTLQERPALLRKAASRLASTQLSSVEGRLSRLTMLRDD